MAKSVSITIDSDKGSTTQFKAVNDIDAIQIVVGVDGQEFIDYTGKSFKRKIGFKPKT